MRSTVAWRASAALLLSSQMLGVAAIALDVDSTDSIKAAASIIASDLINNYYYGDLAYNTASGVVGLLPEPYYWWESGAMWGALVNYWHFTGDTTYNNITTVGLQSQIGQYEDYEPASEEAQLGNDDQGFWGMAVLAAAEYGFPNPPSDEPQWLALAQAVFNRQAERWDNATCNGGLRWQIFPFNGGYDYKNSISNGILFNLAARLAKYTGNTTYTEWAVRAYDWELDIGLINYHNLAIYDGTTPSQNCTEIDHLQWSYVVGVHLLGAAVMWNMTQEDLWYTRTQIMLNMTKTFLREDEANTTPYIMYEAECEASINCDNDQLSFKAYLAEWMAATTAVAPWTYDEIRARLVPSAQAAAAICTGGTNGTLCGFRWYTGTFDGLTGPGQEMDALEIIQGLLITEAAAPVTSTTGGTSQGDSSAGTGTGTTIDLHLYNITSSDKAGAWVITVVLIILMLSGAVWVLWQ